VVGVRTPSLYKHFASKQALFEAVLQRLLDPYFEALEDSLQLPTGPGEADANLRAIVERYWRTPNLARLVQHAALAGGSQIELLVERWYGPLFERAARFSVVPLTARGKAPRKGSTQHRQAMRLALTFHAFMSGTLTQPAATDVNGTTHAFDAQAAAGSKFTTKQFCLYEGCHHFEISDGAPADMSWLLSRRCARRRSNSKAMDTPLLLASMGVRPARASQE